MNTNMEAGKILYSLASGTSLGEIERAEGFVDEMFETHEGVRKVARILDTVAGLEGVPHYTTERVLQDKIANGLYDNGLAAKMIIEDHFEQHMVKESKGILAAVPGVVSGTTGTIMDMAKTTALLAAAGGAALGSGYWLLNNKMDNDSHDGLSRVGLEQRIKTYEKAIGDTKRKNVRTRTQRAKQKIMHTVKSLRRGAYEELT